MTVDLLRAALIRKCCKGVTACLTMSLMEGFTPERQPGESRAHQLMRAGPVLLAYGTGLEAEDLALRLAAVLDDADTETVAIPIDEVEGLRIAPFRSVVFVLPHQITGTTKATFRPFVQALRQYRAYRSLGLDDALAGRAPGYEVGIVHVVGPPGALGWIRRALDGTTVCREHRVVASTVLDLFADDDRSPEQARASAGMDATRDAFDRARDFIAGFWPAGEAPDADDLCRFFEQRRAHYNNPKPGRRYPAASLHRPLGKTDPRNAFDLILDGTTPEDLDLVVSKYYAEELQRAARQSVAALAAAFPGYDRPYRLRKHLRDLYLAARIVQQARRLRHR